MLKKRAGELVEKKLIAINTTIMLGLGSVFAIPSVQAETSIQSQRTEIQSKVDEAKQLIQELTSRTKQH